MTLAMDDPEVAGSVEPTETVASMVRDWAQRAPAQIVMREKDFAFDNFDYARALERTEGFFWNFTDDHVE